MAQLFAGLPRFAPTRSVGVFVAINQFNVGLATSIMAPRTP
jgi:hypothetical protein